jgi:hypothetical protein
MILRRLPLPLVPCLLLVAAAPPEKREPNYDEAEVPKYELPDPLVTQDGRTVRDAKTWLEVRRPEILRLYETRIHGRSPDRPEAMRFETLETDPHALGGKAVREQVRVHFSSSKNGPKADILIYVPAAATKPVPVFLCLSFSPNHRVHADPGILLSDSWDRKEKKKRAEDETTRGASSKPWPIETILARGYGIAILYYCDIEPDFEGGMKDGVRPLFFKDGQTEPAPDEWGAIAVWAWGMSRALDYLETDPRVDGRRVIALGQSRLGKTALWAGARDTRFAMVVASCSGEMGAALSRRDYGETVDDMIRAFPYQFAGNFREFAGRWNDLPVDAHMLVALVAPRPLFLNTGSEDQWSDPKGEFLAAIAAEPVYRLLGVSGLGTETMPKLDEPVMSGSIAFSCHTGKHEILASDWDRFLDFADRHLKTKD